jgi:hypothetical protein
MLGNTLGKRSVRWLVGVSDTTPLVVISATSSPPAAHIDENPLDSQFPRKTTEPTGVSMSKAELQSKYRSPCLSKATPVGSHTSVLSTRFSACRS